MVNEPLVFELSRFYCRYLEKTNIDFTNGFLLNPTCIRLYIVCLINLCRLAPIVSALMFFVVIVVLSLFFIIYLFIYLFICRSLSLYCSCIYLFNSFYCFTRSFPQRDITHKIIISCTRLHTFEKKSENDRKIESGNRL